VVEKAETGASDPLALSERARATIGSSACISSSAHCAGERPPVSTTFAGELGGSYGASTPVNPASSPAHARRYKPFGSRASQTASGVLTNTSTKREVPTIVRTSARSCRYGEISAAITIAGIGEVHCEPASEATTPHLTSVAFTSRAYSSRKRGLRE
jgi:hypothetical protein